MSGSAMASPSDRIEIAKLAERVENISDRFDERAMETRAMLQEILQRLQEFMDRLQGLERWREAHEAVMRVGGNTTENMTAKIEEANRRIIALENAEERRRGGRAMLYTMWVLLGGAVTGTVISLISIAMHKLWP